MRKQKIKHSSNVFYFTFINAVFNFKETVDSLIQKDLQVRDSKNSRPLRAKPFRLFILLVKGEASRGRVLCSRLLAPPPLSGMGGRPARPGGNPRR